MNRRSFLGLLGLGAAGLVLDPERLLWVPGQKTFFIPETPRIVTALPTRGNSLLTIDIITREALRVLHDNLKMAAMLNRQYNDRFDGTIVNIRREPEACWRRA